MRRIGIMGGTFDPIHNGHLVLGKQALNQFHLDEIWYMPSGQPPHKKDHKVTNFTHRCLMVKLAIEPFDKFFFSDFEIKKSGDTYTAKTLLQLKNDYPKHKFFFILGEDSLYKIEQWNQPALIMKMIPLLVAKRTCKDHDCSLSQQIHHLEKTYGARIELLDCEKVEISSKEIRKSFREGKKPSSFLPSTVYEYINTHSLYEEME